MTGPVAFEVQESPPIVVIVTGSDGARCEVKIATLILGVTDTGLLNPLDQLPLFNLNIQPIVQVKRKENA
jgi:hypothetical protein